MMFYILYPALGSAVPLLVYFERVCLFTFWRSSRRKKTTTKQSLAVQRTGDRNQKLRQMVRRCHHFNHRGEIDSTRDGHRLPFCIFPRHPARLFRTVLYGTKKTNVSSISLPNRSLQISTGQLQHVAQVIFLCYC